MLSQSLTGLRQGIAHPEKPDHSDGLMGVFLSCSASISNTTLRLAGT
ncbi:hypothetical protein [Acetobacter cibinongensis]|nr:hypothetical protein [Acetobacter cibinongensis]